MVSIKKLKKEILSSDVIILSFPKSGRTWLRFFLAKYIQLQFHKNFDLENIEFQNGDKVMFSHDFFHLYQDIEKQPIVLASKEMLNKKLVLLVRDPRDVIVSYYHHKKDRNGLSVGSIDEFIKSNIYGIERQSDFVLQIIDFWEKKLNNKILINYNNLLDQPEDNFFKLIKFIYPDYDNRNLRSAIKESTFVKMRNYETALSQNSKGELIRMGVKNWDGNENALKTRKGKAGSYKEELDPATIKYISQLPKTGQLLEKLKTLN